MVNIEVKGETLSLNAGQLTAHARLVLDAILTEDERQMSVTIEVDEASWLRIVLGLRGECGLPVGPWDGTSPIRIKLDPSRPPQELLSTFTHELVHAKQVLRGEVYREAGRVVWAATPDNSYLASSYSDLPWEKEAFAVQERYHGRRDRVWRTKPKPKPLSGRYGFGFKTTWDPRPRPAPKPDKPQRFWEIRYADGEGRAVMPGPGSRLLPLPPKPSPLIPPKDRTSLLGLILPTPEDVHKVTGLPPLPELPPTKEPQASWEYYLRPYTIPKDTLK